MIRRHHSAVNESGDGVFPRAAIVPAGHVEYASVVPTACERCGPA